MVFHGSGMTDSLEGWSEIMLDSMKYINHLGEEIEFGVGGIVINTNDFRDYEWSYNSRFKKIVNFEKQIMKRTLPVLISAADAKAKANRIFEIIDKDVLAQKHGTILINGYSLKGFFYSSKKIDYTMEGILKLDLAFVSDMPYWTKETKTSYTEGTKGAGGLNFPHNYDFDYTSSMYVSQIVNEHYVEANFRIIFKGAIVNPLINIAGNTYQVNGIVEEDEQLVVDSVEKKIYLIKADGTIVNKFADRNKNTNIFQPIPSGVSAVTWETDFPFDIVLVEQRSEPKWN